MSTRPITDTFRQLRQGTFIDDASDELNRVVRAVDETGKAGKITIELTIKKATRGGAMIITDKITAKCPTDGPQETMMFATPEGNLDVNDPRQAKLPLKEVAKDTGPLKDVSRPTPPEDLGLSA